MDIDNCFLLSEDEDDESIMNEILMLCNSSNSEDSDDSSDDSDEELICLLLLSRERRKGVQQYLLTKIPEYTDNEFRMHFRINRLLFDFLSTKYKESEIFKELDQSKVYSAEMHMALFLWFAGHKACSYRDIADRFNVAISTAHDIILRTIYFISNLSESVILWPNDDEKKISGNYFRMRHGLKGVLGVLGGTHIRIDPPKSEKDVYINRKNVCSIHIQGVCNEKGKFIDVFIGYPGSVHDNRVLENSEVFPKLQSLCGEYFILGDSVHACSNYIITPYHDNRHLTQKQKFFNRTLSSSRAVIEHSFRLLKQRFRQLHHCKLKGFKKLCHFIRACVVLHNLANDDLLEAETTAIGTSEGDEKIPAVPERSSLRRDCLSDELFKNAKGDQN